MVTIRSFSFAAALFLAAGLCIAAPSALTPAATAQQAQTLSAAASSATARLAQALEAGDATQARRIAADRMAALRALLEVAPDQVPALLLSRSEAADAAQVVGAAVETWLGPIEATLWVYHFDDFDRGIAWDEHVLEWEGQRFDLFGIEGLSRGLRDGLKVTMQDAVRIDDAILAMSAVEEAAGAQTKSNRYAQANILVMMVNFQDEVSAPFTKAQMEAAMDTNRRWYDEVSYGKQTTTHVVSDWVTLPINKADCPWSAVSREARLAATAAGFDLSRYNILGFVFPRNSSCAWAGLGGGGNFWLNGNTSLRVISHEVGHVLGFGHARSRRCPDGNYVDGVGCAEEEYGSPFDVMGAASSGHFHPGAKERIDYLGDLPSTQAVQSVTQSGDYDIRPYASPVTGFKALMIPRLANDTLNVEYRQAFGFDASLGTRIGPRVQITTGTNTLLDMKPDTTTWNDASLEVGATYDETGSGIRVTLLEVNAERARVRVALDPCGRIAPLVQATDVTPLSLRGEMKRIRLHVSNLDNPGSCSSPTTFTYSATPFTNATLPPLTSRPDQLVVAPGRSGSADLDFDVPAGFTGNLAFTLEVRNSARPMLRFRGSQSFALATHRLTVVGGDSQSAATGSAFGTPLGVRLVDARGTAAAGIQISFTAPGPTSGTSPSVILGTSARCTTAANGECSVTATANARVGTYAVRASAPTAAGEALIRLSNTGTAAAPDTTPDAGLVFAARSGVALDAPVISTSARIREINVPAPISVVNGEYSIGCDGAFAAAPGTVLAGAQVCVRHTSSRSGLSSVTTRLTVGTSTAEFTSTTAAGGAATGSAPPDITPDAFAFAPQQSVAAEAAVTSAAVTISGINARTSIAVAGGSYSIGCGSSFTSAAGTIGAGERVCVRHTSARRASASTATTLTVGGVAAQFRSTTAASIRPRSADQFDLSGGWFEPETAGQGLMIELYTSAAMGAGQRPYLFAGWFTYTDRVGGVAEQDWYALEGLGTVDGRVFQLTIGRPNAGRFDVGPSAGAPVNLGSATLTFSSCTEAVLDFQFSAAAGGRSGQVLLDRLLRNVSCDEDAAAANAPRGFLDTGAWFEPATSGQGLLFEVNPVSRLLFGAWYTYAADGPADYRWFTLQLGDVDANARRYVAVPILESTGGRLDQPATVATRQVGEATLQFDTCTSGRMTYRFTIGELAGRTGEIPLTRVGPAPTECR